jgi:hypothetical protein
MAIYTFGFWREVSERAVKSAAQGVLLAIGASSATPVDLFALDARVLVGAGLGMGFLSALTSLATKPLGSDKESPSMV